MIKDNFQVKTKNFIIRPYALSDFEIWKESFQDIKRARNKWDLSAYIANDLSLTRFKKILKTQKTNRKNDTFYDFAVFDKKTKLIVGNVSIMDVSRGVFQNAYLGYGVLSPYWGQGYAKEFCLEALKIAFKTLKLHRLEAGINKTNLRSKRLARAIGMRREGHSKRRLFLNGEWRDFDIFAITAEEIGIKGAKGSLMANRR